MIWLFWWLPLRSIPLLRDLWLPAPVRDTPARTPVAPRRTRIGVFVLGEELARGGEGRIWLSVGPHGAKCVVKVSRSRRIDRMRQDAIAREAEFLRALQGRGVPGLLDQGDDPRYGRYLVASFIEGVPVQQWMSSHGAADGLAVLSRLARRIAHCHQLGIIHGDIRPENILVDARDQPWLIDFGQGRWRHQQPDPADDEAAAADLRGVMGMLPGLLNSDLAEFQLKACRRLLSESGFLAPNASSLATQLERIVAAASPARAPLHPPGQRLKNWVVLALALTSFGLGIVWWLNR